VRMMFCIVLLIDIVIPFLEAAYTTASD
jgi:hypothetical protein